MYRGDSSVWSNQTAELRQGSAPRRHRPSGEAAQEKGPWEVGQAPCLGPTREAHDETSCAHAEEERPFCGRMDGQDKEKKKEIIDERHGGAGTLSS